MKKIIIFLILLFIFTAATYAEDDFSKKFEGSKRFFTWQPLFFDTMHSCQTFYCNIYYYDEDAASDVINGIDDVYQTILNDVGCYTPASFDKINIYIYRTKEEYLQKTGINTWAGGHLNFRQKAIYTYSQEKLMPDVIVHELTHTILDHYLNFKNMLNIRWLQEGLAVYEGKKYTKEWINVKNLKEIKRQGRLIPLRQGIYTSIGLEPSSQRVSLWYNQMGMLVDYMLSLGINGFTMFCANLKDLRNIDEALEKTYPWDFKNIDDLEQKWLQWIDKQNDFIQY